MSFTAKVHMSKVPGKLRKEHTLQVSMKEMITGVGRFFTKKKFPKIVEK